MSDNQTSFRDRPLAIDEKGGRKWIYAKKPKGKWATRRSIFAVGALIFLVLAPIIKVGGNPLMMLDVAHRKFILFGNIFFAQDTFILALIMAVTVVFVVLFTVIFGRLWCGWACPQTIFLEFVFRRIEYLFDGNYRSKNRKPPSLSRTIAKHITFYITAFVITNVLLMWFVGPQGIQNLYTTSFRANLLGFTFLAGITTFYYWIYAFFREQVCTMVCPYGRMQSVLLDSRSIAVVYDFKRGEPRGAKQSGDCIDCGACISVCPTGIDIKNGSQLECVNCTACIDECDSVMTKIKKPKGLIRYDSFEGVESGKRSILNTRTYAYSAVLLALFSVLVITVVRRTSIDTSMLRVSGTTFQQVDDTTISNIYNAKIVNKTNKDKQLDLRLIDPEEGDIQLAGKKAFIEKHKVFESIIIIRLKTKYLKGKSTNIKMGIFEKDMLLETVDLNFIGPRQ